MSDTEVSKVGTVGWFDLTVGPAEAIRDFYQAVVGCTAQALDMGDYSDFVMNAPASGDGVAGICHARGANADMPAQWMIYITVADVAASIAQCLALGGAVVTGLRDVDGGSFAVIRDPAGAVCGLWCPPPT